MQDFTFNRGAWLITGIAPTDLKFNLFPACAARQTCKTPFT